MTAKEVAVLRLVYEGLCNKSIADRLHISPLTVKNHLMAIHGRLGVWGVGARVNAIRRGLQEGILRPPFVVHTMQWAGIEVPPTPTYTDPPVVEPAKPEHIKQAATVTATDWLQYGRIMISGEWRLLRIDGKDVDIDKTDFNLFLLLLSHVGHVFTRQAILDQCWGEDVAVEDRRVDVHIRRLRALLDSRVISDVIETVTGVGYKIAQKIPLSCEERNLTIETPQGTKL
jgi:DNA-binding response OmpR family regulator